MKYTTAQWTQTEWPYLTPKHYTLDQSALCGYEPETGAEFRTVPLVPGTTMQQRPTCHECWSRYLRQEAAKEK